MTAQTMPMVPAPGNPFYQMDKLDREGFAYWLESVRLSDGEIIPSADVISHDCGWLHLTHELWDRSIWVRVDHVISFSLVKA